jgi:TATA-binding protein-associated factor Taf7
VVETVRLRNELTSHQQQLEDPKRQLEEEKSYIKAVASLPEDVRERIVPEVEEKKEDKKEELQKEKAEERSPNSEAKEEGEITEVQTQRVVEFLSAVEKSLGAVKADIKLQLQLHGEW